MLETKIQLLRKAAFEKVDVDKGLAAFKVGQPDGPQAYCVESLSEMLTC